MNRNDPSPWPPAELARRRSGARRLAWLIGGAALLLYIAGLFIRR